MGRVPLVEFANFSEIEEEFIRRAHEAVLCCAATIDLRNRPRTRVLHPLWESATGWVTTRRSSPKVKHLAVNPHLSLAYIVDPFRPTYVKCTAEWVGDLEVRRRIWDVFRHMPPPFVNDTNHVAGCSQSPNPARDNESTRRPSPSRATVSMTDRPVAHPPIARAR